VDFHVLKRVQIGMWYQLVVLLLTSLVSSTGFITIDDVSTNNWTYPYDVGNCTYLPYMFVNFTRNGKDKVYFIRKGVARLVKHRETIESFGLNPDTLFHFKPEEFYKLVIGDPLPLITKSDHNLQLWTERIRQKSRVTQGKLTNTVEMLGQYANPSVVKWHNRLLMATGSNWGVLEEGPVPRWTLTFRWIDHPKFPLPPKARNAGSSSRDTSVNMSDSATRNMFCIDADHANNISDVKPIRGEDPRIVIINDTSIQVYYTNFFLFPWDRMGLAEFTVNPQSGCLELIQNYPQIYVHEYRRHKNWSPFIYDNQVYLISSVNPFTVVRAKVFHFKFRTPGPSLKQEIISKAPIAEMHWPYGEVRGGTNAVRLADGNYLSFFHSYVNRIPYRRLRVYFYGAYIFSGHPPFHLLAVSPMPIMPDSLYTGPKPVHNELGPEIEYVVFPVSIFLDQDSRSGVGSEGEGGGGKSAGVSVGVSVGVGMDVVLSAGVNDRNATLMRLNLDQLIGSLIPVREYVWDGSNFEFQYP